MAIQETSLGTMSFHFFNRYAMFCLLYTLSFPPLMSNTMYYQIPITSDEKYRFDYLNLFSE